MARKRCFTLIELLVVLGVILILVIMIVVLQPPRSRSTRHQLKDATQVRGIHQSMTTWAQNNKGRYPLPSELDLNNATFPEIGRAKDTTANIFSILVFEGFIPVDMTVSPLEVNANIEKYVDYEFDAPPAAVDPAGALWDPAFSTDFTGNNIAHNSYAHIPPDDARLKAGHWSDSMEANVPVLGNRGPEIASVTYDKKGKAKPTLANPLSNTLLIHGSRITWEGNIAYNDNRVAFETSLAPDGLTFTDAAGKTRGDVLFYNEPDDPLNAFLGIFITAGPNLEDYEAIWD